MSVQPSTASTDDRVCLHPSVGVADPAKLTASQQAAALAMVRGLEHELLEGERARRSLSVDQVEQLIARINHLRRALGWLEVSISGQWRWPEVAA